MRKAACGEKRQGSDDDEEEKCFKDQTKGKEHDLKILVGLKPFRKWLRGNWWYSCQSISLLKYDFKYRSTPYFFVSLENMSHWCVGLKTTWIKCILIPSSACTSKCFCLMMWINVISSLHNSSNVFTVFYTFIKSLTTSHTHCSVSWVM